MAIDSNPEYLNTLLQNRKKTGNKNDGHTIGLFLTGGGMSGVFGGGVVQVIQDMKIAETFDYIYGLSSGAFSAAYMLSGNSDIGTSIYYENLNGVKFIKPWRLHRSMDMDYFCDKVVRDIKPLNIENIKKSNVIFKIYMTDAETGKLDYYSNKDDEDMITLMKASCSFPGFSKNVQINGHRYTDGEALEFSPFSIALEDFCTDILVVTPLPSSFRASTGDLVNVFSPILTLGYGRNFKEKQKKSVQLYNQNLDYIFGRKQLPKANIYRIAPDYFVSLMETRKSKLKEFEEHGKAKANEFFKV